MAFSDPPVVDVDSTDVPGAAPTNPRGTARISARGPGSLWTGAKRRWSAATQRLRQSARPLWIRTIFLLGFVLLGFVIATIVVLLVIPLMLVLLLLRALSIRRPQEPGNFTAGAKRGSALGSSRTQ